jgi:hypothetical protein
MFQSTKLRLYNIIPKAALKYDSEVWVLNKRILSTIGNSTNEISEITLGLTRLGHQRNTTIRGKRKAEHIVDEIQSYQKNCLQHVRRLEHARIPRLALAHKPKGKRNIDRPKTRWRDQQHLQD